MRKEQPPRKEHNNEGQLQERREREEIIWYLTIRYLQISAEQYTNDYTAILQSIITNSRDKQVFTKEMYINGLSYQ